MNLPSLRTTILCVFITMKLSLIYFFCITAITTYSQINIPSPKIMKLNFLDKIDTLVDGNNNEIRFAKQESFIVRNFHEKDSINIDLFVEKNRDKNWAKKYFTYAIAFYKESKMTNYDSIFKNRQILGKYSVGNDLIYYYLWADNKFDGKQKITHVKSNISVEDIER